VTVRRHVKEEQTMAVSIRSGASESLAEAILRLVQLQTGGRIRDLEVAVNGNGRDVVISGRTTSYYVKQLATHAALDLAGEFKTLSNDIIVG
jgi:hypothetical protein